MQHLPYDCISLHVTPPPQTRASCSKVASPCQALVAPYYSEDQTGKHGDAAQQDCSLTCGMWARALL